MNTLSRSPKTQIKVGSRGSPLALAQVKEVFSYLAKQEIMVEYKQVIYQTRGDQDKTTSLMINPAENFFTDTLDQALLKGDIDIAIHSAKDLPQPLHKDLKIFALTSSVDDTDAFVGKVRFSQLKNGATVGTSSLLRQQSLLKLNSKVKIVDIRGTIEERVALVEQGQCDGVVVATAALKRLGLQKRIKEVFPWETMPLQGQLAVVGRRGDEELRGIFSAIDVRKKYGQVTLVGAGPGDPELITAKGIKALKKADCVFYDYLVHSDVLLYAAKAEKVYVGKRKGEHTLAQEELSRMLRQKAMAGENVVRLKGGDPLIFGRGADEIQYLRSYHIKVEVIPGISSATGIPSGLGIPLTARGVASSVAFLSGHGESEDNQHPQPIEIPKADTVIFLMGLTKLDLIVQSLKKNGWPDQIPVMIVCQGTRLQESIVSGTVATIQKLAAAENLQPPALIIVGEVVKFWQAASSARETILYAGTHPERYKSLGRIIPFPMIQISEVELKSEEIKIFKVNLLQYDWIILTSRFAVQYFFAQLKKLHYPIDRLKKVDFAVIGKETAEALSFYDITPKVTAAVETSEGLLQILKDEYKLKGKKFLFPRSSLSNPFLKKELTKLGAKIKEVTIYQNTKPDWRELPKDNIDKVLFTSPSTVQNFLEDYGTIPRHWQILCRGPYTQKALQQFGYESEVLVYE
ncbi:MAG: hypothetical protein A3D10_08790 [Omnitrophica WOR_2 bacterium RIFCSPHIGHO2_02_FULL_48_11]|nr:MAG: hypothetical protein A3D10_08790 [Omnitrophica WOR_2 bacterium RIFCSPHIGHO2_02_FULL_48_11]